MNPFDYHIVAPNEHFSCWRLFRGSKYLASIGNSDDSPAETHLEAVGILSALMEQAKEEAACPNCMNGENPYFDREGNERGMQKCERCNGAGRLLISEVLKESEQYRAAARALEGRLGNYDHLEGVEEACRQYVLAEDHLPDIYDDEDYTLSGAVESLVNYKAERDVLLTRTEEMGSDVKLIESLDDLISGDDSVSLCEEDGGVICSVNRNRTQNNYVGSTAREALTEAIREEKV